MKPKCEYYFFQMPPQMPPIQQLQPNNHQIGSQQGPTIHVSPGQAQAGRHISPQSAPSQLSQQAPPPTQIGLPPIPQGHMGPSSGPIVSGSHVPTGAVPVGLPPQIGSQQPTLPGTQGSSISTHISNTVISSQPSGVIQVPAGTNSGPVSATSQALPGPQTSGIPTMQGMAQIPAAQPMPFQPAPPGPTVTNETRQDTEDIKPRTAELISFD